MEQKLIKACKEIFKEEDLKISTDLQKQIEQKGILVKTLFDSERAFLKIYSINKLRLSDLIPLLHNFGLEAIEEVSYEIFTENEKIHVNRFLLEEKIKEPLQKHRSTVTSLLESAIRGDIVCDSALYSLALKEGLDYKKIFLLESIIRYEDQIVPEFNKNTILDTFVKYGETASLLIETFLTKFDPDENRRKEYETLCSRLKESIKSAENITEDKILSLALKIVQNATRTNYFKNKSAISFKMDTAFLESMLNGIQPRIEMFVSHPKMSGVHLRMDKISRGGLRWSERFDDYREEIKSLMSTQEAKNAIIVPSGAKGGFVIFEDKKKLSKDSFKEYYSIFIDSLLDLIDNKGSNYEGVKYDGDDFYFVVAADKGTAAMSDVANSIAIGRGFWLHDAFASGGSNGYNHKKLGVTAKGAWRSASRFFIEKKIDIYSDTISVVAIGSMRGDVCGNGLLINPNIRLLGAVSSKEIFVDPDPNPLTAYRERKRLFKESLHWRDYDKNLISKGGGVFSRDQKEIELSAEMRKLFKTRAKVVSGSELAKMVLTMEVDLLYNGGVGTYVKSSEEANLHLGDKENESVRVNAADLKCYAVCEGGNLGFTQLARIEYSKNGGKINLDSIDNSAGVDTSDHEVNIKIVLNELKRKGQIDEKERIKTLENLTDKVLNSVFWTNYLQPLSITLDQIRSKTEPEKFVKCTEIIENSIKVFKRRDFHIPKNSEFERVFDSKGEILRPILGILLSYSKLLLKKSILGSDLPDSTFARHYLYKYFPKNFSTIYEKEVGAHPLKREIVATMIANKIINFHGITFIHDYEELGEDFIKKIEAYLIINRLIGANDVRFEIYRNDLKIDSALSYRLLLELEEAIAFSVGWMVKKEKRVDPVYMLAYKEEIEAVLKNADKKIARKSLTEIESIDRFFTYLDYLKFTAAAIDLKEQTHLSFAEVAKLFYLIIERFNINDILGSIADLKPLGEYERRVQKELTELVEFFVTALAKKILGFTRVEENIEESFESYIGRNFAKNSILLEISNFKTQESRNLAHLSHIVNSLVLSVV